MVLLWFPSTGRLVVKRLGLCIFLLVNYSLLSLMYPNFKGFKRFLRATLDVDFSSFVATTYSWRPAQQGMPYSVNYEIGSNIKRTFFYLGEQILGLEAEMSRLTRSFGSFSIIGKNILKVVQSIALVDVKVLPDQKPELNLNSFNMSLRRY